VAQRAETCGRPERRGRQPAAEWALTRTLGGGGPIYALAPTDTATVPVHAVLWLDDESAT